MLGAALFATCLIVSLLASPGMQTVAAPSIQTDEDALGPLVGVAGGSGATLWDKASGDAVVDLAPGDRVSVYARSGDGKWYFVETEQGLAGWAATEAILVVRPQRLPDESVTLAPVTPTPAPAPAASLRSDAVVTTTETVTPSVATVITEDERLNVRAGPGRSYDVIAKALPGEQYAVLGQSRGRSWVEITLDEIAGTSGWVSAEFVELGNGTGKMASGKMAATGPAAAEASSAPSDGTVAASMPQHVAKNVGSAGLNGKIVFQNRGGGGIYVYELASGRLNKVADGIDPALSPDGSQIVFTRSGGENGIYIVPASGGDVRQIFGERELLRSPKWSPDGQYIVFSRGDEFIDCYVISGGRCMKAEWIHGNMPWLSLAELEKRQERHFKLARVDTNGGSYQDLVVLASATAPDWSAGGIVYQSKAGIQITQDRPSAETVLVYFDILKQFHHDPDWQQNGGRILYQQKEGSHWEIFAINPDGSGRVALTRPEFTLVEQLPSNAAPAWSPDGAHIVFISNREPNHEAGAWRIWVMNADGSNQRPLPINVPIEYGFDSAQMADWGP